MSSRAITSDSHSMTQQAPATSLEDMDSIIATYEQRVFRFHLISVRDRDLAQSLTQDTFVRAWAARHTFRGDCSISTWLMRIALNLIRDHTRTVFVSGNECQRQQSMYPTFRRMFPTATVRWSRVSSQASRWRWYGRAWHNSPTASEAFFFYGFWRSWNCRR
jgi:hypothetical protein